MNISELAQDFSRNLDASRKAARDAWRRSAFNVRERWLDRLDEIAPHGVDSRGGENIDDAYRHFMSYGTGSQYVADFFAVAFGDAGEVFTKDAGSAEMDKHNNRQGVKAESRANDTFEPGMLFVEKVVKGELKIKDTEGGGYRDTNILDIGWDGAPNDAGSDQIDSLPKDATRDDDTYYA